MFLIVAMIASSISSSICVKEPVYNEEQSMCLMSDEDIWKQKHLKMVSGRAHGRKTSFFIQSIPFKNNSGHQQWLRAGAAHNSFTKLFEDAKKKGFRFGVNSAYRSWRHQVRLWREMPDIASNPWRSGARSHMTGYAVDFSGTYAFVPFERIKPKWFSAKWCKPREGGFECPTRFFWWLRKNAHEYGIRNTVKSEPWHWVFVGKEERRKLVSD